MKKWLYRIVWVPVFIFAVLFLFANRQMVTISLDPFNANSPLITSFPAPLWVWLIFAVFVGVALGSAGMWVSGGHRREKARVEHRELKSLRREILALREQNPPEEPKPFQSEPPLLQSSEQ